MWIIACMSSIAVVPPSVTPTWELHTTQRIHRNAEIGTILANGTMKLADDSEIPADRVLSLRREKMLVPFRPVGPQLWLTTGDCLLGKVQSASANAIEFAVEINSNREERNIRQTVQFPRTSIDLLWLTSCDRYQLELKYDWLKGPRKADYILLLNGDVFQGTVAGIEREKSELLLDREGKTKAIPLAQIEVVAFNKELSRTRYPTEGYTHLVCRNGTRIQLRQVVLQDQQLKCETLAKRSILIPFTEVVALDRYFPKVAYLSELKPKQYAYRSYLGERYALAVNESLDHRELSLRNAEGITCFDNGIAVHAPCTVQYDLAGSWKRFEATVGLDPRLGKRGSVRIRILVDGKDVTPDPLRKLLDAQMSYPISIPIENGKELNLEIEAGEGGNVNDCVTWGDARLIR